MPDYIGAAMAFNFLLFSFAFITAIATSSGEFFRGDFEATSLFGATANSTCGDPPTNFNYNGQLFNCTAGEHASSFAVDGNPDTWWQSTNEEDPVELVFSLIEQRVSLVLTGIQLHIRSQPPLFYHLQLYGRNSDLLLEMVYASDLATCAIQTLPCVAFTANDSVINLMFPNTSSEPVAEFRLILTGNDLLPESSYHAIMEVDISAQVADGFFARSLDDLRVEGESGMILDPVSSVPHNSDPSLFPGYSGRGYASLNYSSSENVMGQWTFPSLPSSSDYKFSFLYSNHVKRSRRLSVVVAQGSQRYDARMTFNASCVKCSAFLSSPDQASVPFNVSLTQSLVSITVSLSSIDISLDAIVAVPREFFDPTNLAASRQFLQECNIISGSFNDSTCVSSAIQLSISYFRSTFACSCAASVEGNCRVYGGQCECPLPSQPGTSSLIGRQCELCPFFSYRTVSGCNACTCPEQLDDCSMETGQCAGCPDLAFGSGCEKCVENSFKSSNSTCLPCECNSIGSTGCNQISGACICKEGVGGGLCDQCAIGYFQFSSNGCRPCDCGLASVNQSCNDLGECFCKEGVAGPKCSNCSDGFFSLSAVQGCLPCSCSNRTNQCSLAPNATETSRELCNCPFPFAGLSCESCVPGYHMSDSTNSCELCECNGRADTCTDGSGECLDCSNNSTGSSCEFCIDGMYNANLLDGGFSCEPCPCSTVTATNTSCATDLLGQPSCYCLPGHVGLLCDNCSNAYYGSPPETRCTDCSCNGNIDRSTLGSCDPVTGVCLLCINNSDGPECEFCESGYFGDARTQNCQPCDCEEGGSSSSLCDRNNGQCPCLEGVGGVRCDRCQEGFWNFTLERGCQPCICSAASNGSMCDPLSGQCPCSYGVQGLNCSSCMDGFFSFTVTGCSECDCGAGALNNTCSSDGVCSCLPGVTGARCDQCLQFHFSLSSASGCQPCGGCEGMLASRLTASDISLARIRMDVNLFQIFMSTDSSGNTFINTSLLTLSSRRTESFGVLSAIEISLNRLGETDLASAILYSTVTRLQTEAALNRTLSMLSYAVTVQQHVIEVHDMMQDVFIDTGDVSTLIGRSRNLLEGYARQITANLSSVTGHDIAALPITQARATLSDFLAAQQDMNILFRLVLGQQNQTSTIKERCSSLDLSDISNQLSNIGNLLYSYNNQCLNVSQAASSLAPVVVHIESSIALANVSILVAEAAISQAQMLVVVIVRGDIETFDSLVVGSSSAGVSSGSGIGSGELLSGSGEEVEGSVIIPPGDITSVVGGLSTLSMATDSLKSVFLRQQAQIELASNTSHLMQVAQELNNAITPALFRGNLSVEAILDYADILDSLLLINSLSNQTERILQDILKQSSPLLEDNLSRQVSYFVNSSNQLHNATQIQSSSLDQLLVSMRIANVQEADATQSTLRSHNVVTQVTSQVDGLERAASMVSGDVGQTLIQVDNLVAMVQDTSASISSALPPLLANASQLVANINDSQLLFSSAQMMINMANNTASVARGAVEERSFLLSNIDQVKNSNQGQLSRVNSTLSILRMRLSEAVSAAAMIDVALQFHGNSSLSYPLTRAPPTMESVSLVLRPENVSSGNFLSTSREEEHGGPVVLHLQNGSVSIEYGTGSLSAGGGTLQENQWYQLYATRDENELVLSVTSLPWNGSTFTANATAVGFTPPVLFNDVISLGGGTSGGGYVGCLDRVIVNQEQLALLNSLERGVNIATCGPRFPAESDRQFENGTWLLGAGSYIRFSTQLAFSRNRLQFQFRTLADSGILIFLPSSDFMQFIVVYLTDGRVALNCSLSSSIDSQHLETRLSYNSGLWHKVDLLISDFNITLTIGGNETLITTCLQPVPSGPLSLGGLSPEDSILVQGIIDSRSIAGCVRDLQINGSIVNLRDSENNRVDLSGCPGMVAPGVRFSGDGRAEFALSEQLLYSISFGFRTTQLASLLLHLQGLSISVFHAKIRVDLSSESLHLTSRESGLNDNTRHTVTLTFSNSSGNDTVAVSLTVDGKTSATSILPGTLMISGTLFVGGISNQSLPVAEVFRGCIDSLAINGRTLDFNDARNLLNVSLYGCRPARQLEPPITPTPPPPPPPPPPPLPPPPSIPPNVSVGLSGRNGTFISLHVSEATVINNFSIILEFLTISSEGLLLYMQGVVYDDFFALQLISGRLVFSYDLGSGRIQLSSNATYNDGMLHRVELWRNSRAGRLTIDRGIETISGDSPGLFSSLNVNSGYLFIGGVPAMLATLSLLRPGEQIPPSVLGCISNFSINGIFEDLTAPQASTGVEQCLQTYSNMVTLRTNSFLRIFDNFNVGIRFSFSVDFRTENCSGVLLYIASSIFPDHVLVELRGGRIVLVFDNGPMREILEYSEGGPLCDGAWHSLSVSKDGRTGSISVDGNIQQTVVSSCAICQNFFATNTNDPLYIGGIPDSLRFRYTVESGSFEGCLSNLYITRDGRSPETIVFSQALEGQNVDFGDCRG